MARVLIGAPRGGNRTMVMFACGTFDYVAELRIDPSGGSGSWIAEAVVREPIDLTGDALRDNRLVGHRPAVQITGGRILLTASSQEFAQMAAASLELDPAFGSIVRSGDSINLVRTHTADLAVSIIRAEQLIVAVGAVTSVALGDAVSVRTNQEWMRSQSAGQSPDGADGPSTCLELSVHGEARALAAGDQVEVGGYRALVDRCFAFGDPGMDESVALWPVDTCPSEAAIRSATLLADGSIDGFGW